MQLSGLAKYLMACWSVLGSFFMPQWYRSCPDESSIFLPLSTRPGRPSPPNPTRRVRSPGSCANRLWVSVPEGRHNVAQGAWLPHRLYRAAAGIARTPPRTNSNRTVQALATVSPPRRAGENVHCRAASVASRAKYALGPGETSVTPVTLPAGSTRTLPVTRTLPRIVLDAPRGTSG